MSAEIFAASMGGANGKRFMKNQSATDEPTTAEILATAKFTYRMLAMALQDAIVRLKEGHENREGAQSREAVVKSHMKSLQQIIDLEVDLAKRSKTVLPSKTAGHEIDFDQAREEIRQRLAKLAGQRSGE